MLSALCDEESALTRVSDYIPYILYLNILSDVYIYKYMYRFLYKPQYETKPLLYISSWIFDKSIPTHQSCVKIPKEPTVHNKSTLSNMLDSAQSGWCSTV